MRKKTKGREGLAGMIDQMLAAFVGHAPSDAEALATFHRLLCATQKLPCQALVIGEPVTLVVLDFDGNPRRGIVARCRRADGSEHEVDAADVVLPPDRGGAGLLDSLRLWSGRVTGLEAGFEVEPLPEARPAASPRRRSRKVAASRGRIGS